MRALSVSDVASPRWVPKAGSCRGAPTAAKPRQKLGLAAAKHPGPDTPAGKRHQRRHLFLCATAVGKGARRQQPLSNVAFGALYRKRGAGPQSSSPGDGHRPVLQKGQGGLSLLWRVSRRAAGSVETGWCRCAGFQGGQTTPSISARNSGRKGCPTAAATV